MDSNVLNINENEFVDIFPDLTTPKGNGFNTPAPVITPDPNEANLLAPVKKEEGTTAVKATETATGAPATGEEANILEGGLGTPAPVTKGTPLTGLEDYYKERIKSGKFVGIKELDAQGKEIDFVPKTAEDYDEVLELELTYRLNQAKEQIQKSWYETKSPAWRAIGQYAELVDDPSELVPFLQGIKTLQSVSELDENQIEGAERIVRTRLEQKGDPDDLINTQINSLKTTDQLIATAKSYKPLILRDEQAQLVAMKRQKEAEDQQYKAMIGEIKAGAIAAITKPVFGKINLKQEEKAAVYDLIGEPSEEGQGYRIYNAIDNLFDKKDYDTLTMLGLFLANKDAFMNYLGINIANHTAATLERKLRVAGDGHSSSGNDQNESSQRTIVKNQFKPARFTTKS